MHEIVILQLGVVGVGRALLRQILATTGLLADRYGLRLRYLALVDRSGVLTDPRGLGEQALHAALIAKNAGRPLPDTRPLLNWTELLPDQPCIVVDTTAAPRLEDDLADAVAAGHRVVLANKRPLCASFDRFLALTAKGATRYEATVGAGLPIMSTLQALLDSGDELLRVEACLSGTLGFLCSELERGAALSEAVLRAKNLGYTEPDPRDDLDGGDVARKALILGRTAGFAWADKPVVASPWFPSEMASLAVDEFLAALPTLDAAYTERVHNAQARGAALRYVATLAPEAASVAFATLPSDHPLAALRGPDNLVALTTVRYRERPLVVRGPGAGSDVTAAGVLADIVATARELAGK